MNNKLSVTRLAGSLGAEIDGLSLSNLNNPFTKHGEVFELAASHGGLADEWHSDISFSPNPSVMSILNVIECPAAGADTTLSPPMQDL